MLFTSNKMLFLFTPNIVDKASQSNIIFSIFSLHSTNYFLYGYYMYSQVSDSFNKEEMPFITLHFIVYQQYSAPTIVQVVTLSVF